MFSVEGRFRTAAKRVLEDRILALYRVAGCGDPYDCAADAVVVCSTESPCPFHRDVFPGIEALAEGLMLDRTVEEPREGFITTHTSLIG
jgi:hypothetical protein